METSPLYKIGRAIGRLNAEMQAVQKWQALHERRQRRFGIVLYLGLVAFAVWLPPEQWKRFAEILAVIKQILP